MIGNVKTHGSGDPKAHIIITMNGSQFYYWKSLIMGNGYVNLLWKLLLMDNGQCNHSAGAKVVNNLINKINRIMN